MFIRWFEPYSAGWYHHSFMLYDPASVISCVTSQSFLSNHFQLMMFKSFLRSKNELGSSPYNKWLWLPYDYLILSNKCYADSRVYGSMRKSCVASGFICCCHLLSEFTQSFVMFRVSSKIIRSLCCAVHAEWWCLCVSTLILLRSFVMISQFYGADAQLLTYNTYDTDVSIKLNTLYFYIAMLNVAPVKKLFFQSQNVTQERHQKQCWGFSRTRIGNHCTMGHLLTSSLASCTAWDSLLKKQH